MPTLFYDFWMKNDGFAFSDGYAGMLLRYKYVGRVIDGYISLCSDVEVLVYI